MNWFKSFFNKKVEVPCTKPEPAGAPLAICLAALRAKGVDVEKEVARPV